MSRMLKSDAKAWRGQDVGGGADVRQIPVGDHTLFHVQTRAKCGSKQEMIPGHQNHIWKWMQAGRDKKET